MFPIGWDKTYCLKFLKEYDEIFFFGDKTYEGGNDHEIYEELKKVGRSYTVVNPEDTIQKLNELFLKWWLSEYSFINIKLCQNTVFMARLCGCCYFYEFYLNMNDYEITKLKKELQRKQELLKEEKEDHRLTQDHLVKIQAVYLSLSRNVIDFIVNWSLIVRPSKK